METKQIFITEEVNSQANLKKLNLESAITISQKTNTWLNKIKNKQTPIYIYDLGFKTSGKIIPINNHINKTGKNPLREKLPPKITFYDISKIYQPQKEGQIAECFGNHPPHTTNATHVQTRHLCNYAIEAYCAGFKIIFGYVVD